MLITLKERVRQWSIKLAIEKQLKPIAVPVASVGGEEAAKEIDSHKSHSAYAATLLTFGSYHLQVHAPDADIDVLCVAPRHVTRSDWFDTKHPWCLLSLLTDDEDVSEMLTVPEAYTPVIKFKVNTTLSLLIITHTSRVITVRWMESL